jgi:hypothetical protein
LLPSFVCDVGWFGGNPTLRFSNKNVPNEIWLSMPGGFQIIPSPDLPETRTRRQRDLLMLESVYGFEVKTVHCRSDSRLEVMFTNETLLVAHDNDDGIPECWELRTDQRGLIVASHGGSFAVWPNS